MSTSTRPVWFITAAAEGLGARATEPALAAGHAVVATDLGPDGMAARFGDLTLVGTLGVASTIIHDRLHDECPAQL